MQKRQKISFIGSALFLLASVLIIFSAPGVTTADEICEEQEKLWMDDCLNNCQGDQGCIDSCCFDYPECCVEEACPPEDQAFVDDCLSTCEGDAATCQNMCCANYPDCACNVKEEACTEAEQKILDSCIENCNGDQACIDSCCFDYPDCECPQIEKEPSCVEELKACHLSCTDMQCWLDCDAANQECANCLSFLRCMDTLCDPSDTACQDLCKQNYPQCLQEEPQKDYNGCYEDCFELYTEPGDILACIDTCQQEFPGDYEKPYELKEPRCFVETTFFDYEDVPAEAWFWAPINFLTRLEIPEGNGTGINSETFHSRIVRGYNRDDEDDSKLKEGMTKDIFLPFRDLNRFEASKIATLVSCYTIPDTQTDISKRIIFSDLDASSNEYMERVIYRTAEVKLVEGYTDGTFKPFQPITRAEFLKLFLTVGEFDVHSQTYASSGFTDVTDPDVWYYPYVAFAAHNDIRIINGYEDGTFRPDEPIARNEAMKIITNTMFALGWIDTMGT